MSMHSLSTNATFHRIDSANQALIGLQRQVKEGQPSGITGKTIDRSEDMLGDSGVNLVCAGYPYDPTTLNAW
jgi:hypothetical protein